MMNKDYIPKDTNDIMAVENLKKMQFETVRKDVSKLLEWLQDAHWVVAEGIAEYLIPYINEIKQELLFILDTNDGMWKYCVINILMSKSQSKLDPSLIKALKRIAENPTNIEAEDTVDDAAKAIIESNLS